MLTSPNSHSIILSVLLFLAYFPLRGQPHYADHSVSFVQQGWEGNRAALFKHLTTEQRAIEASITYEFVESNDLGLVRAVIEDGERKIKVSTAYCRAIFRLMDIYLIEDLFFEEDSFVFVYGDYLSEMFPKAIDDWESPEDYNELTPEEKAAFNADPHTESRYYLYIMLLSVTLAHEVYHHLAPDHLSSEKAKTITERLEEEREADSFAMELFRQAESPIYIFAVVHGTFYLEYDFYRQVNNLERTHPSGLERMMQGIGYSIRYFDDLYPLLKKSGLALSQSELNRQFRKDYFDVLRDQLNSQRRPLRYYEKLAATGDIAAAFKVGYANWLGLGRQSVDLEKAEAYLRESADGGYGIAQFVYALFLQFEHGKAETAYVYHQKAWFNNMPLSKGHLVLMDIYSRKQLIRTGKKLPRSVAKIRANCLENCTDHFGNAPEDCRERYCKNHLGNVDTWVRRFWREGR